MAELLKEASAMLVRRPAISSTGDTAGNPTLESLKTFIEQYELRENHFHSLLRCKEFELAAAIARYEQQKNEAHNELARSRTLGSQVSTFTQTEAELRSQLNIYVEKFKQVNAINIEASAKYWMTALRAIIISHYFQVALLTCCLPGRRYLEQLQRALLDVPQRNGRHVPEDQTPREGQSQSDQKA